MFSTSFGFLCLEAMRGTLNPVVLHGQSRSVIIPVQPDAVCEVGGSTPGLSHGDPGIFHGGGQTEKFVH